MLSLNPPKSGEVGFSVAPPKMEGNQLVSGGLFLSQYMAAGQALTANGRLPVPPGAMPVELLGQLFAEGGSGLPQLFADGSNELPQIFKDLLAQLQAGELGPVSAAPELDGVLQEFQALLQEGDEEAIIGFLQQHQLYISPQAELKPLPANMPASAAAVIAQSVQGRTDVPLPFNAEFGLEAKGSKPLATELANASPTEQAEEMIARPKVAETVEKKEADVIRQVKMSALMNQMAQTGQGGGGTDLGGNSGGRQSGGEQPQAWMTAASSLINGARPIVAVAQAAPLSTAIPLPVQDPGWSNAFANRITWMVRDKVQTAEIRLNPERLGPIEVRIELNDDQARVTISSQHAAVRDIIDSSMPRLREMLNAQGFNLADAQVTDQSLKDRRQQQAQDGGRDDQRSGSAGHEIASGRDTVVEGVDGLNGAIDFYA